MKTAPRFGARMLLVYALAVGCLVITALYTYAYLFEIPYLGLKIDPRRALIQELLVPPAGEPSLQPGDVILKIGPYVWAERTQRIDLPEYLSFPAGEVIPFTIQRGGQILEIPWTNPGITSHEFLGRLSQYWYLALIYWIFGLLTALLVRPRDERWVLMMAMFFLIGLWIIIGAASIGRVWYSSLLIHIVTWPMLAVALHFHWVYPKPLKPLHRGAVAALYLLCAGLVLLDLFRWLPRNLYLAGIGVGVAICMLLLILHLRLFPDQRRQVNLALSGMALILLLTISVGVITYNSNNQLPGDIALFSLLFLPVGYFYALYSSQLGEMEIRRSRNLGLAIFSGLAALILIFIIVLASQVINSAGLLITVTLLCGLGAGLAGAVFYPRFQRWYERAVLKMSLPRSDLLSWYAARLAESLDIQRVVHLLSDHVFPSLLLRQVLIVQLRQLSLEPPDWEIRPLLLFGVAREQVPDSLEVSTLLAPLISNVQTPVGSAVGLEQPAGSWIRLALPLAVEGKITGLCLLGKHDSDDFYRQQEISLLQALMDQTALALVHIELTNRLRLLFQANIQRQEDERSRMARVLHDELLGQMALMIQSTNRTQDNAVFLQAYQVAVQEIRSVIEGLRPSTLNFGLQPALEDLVDGLQETTRKWENPPEITLQLDGGNFRYPERVELQLYRIAQQACQNALQHAGPATVEISASLEEGQVGLSIRDDGCGFVVRHPRGLAALLARKQYGLVGMFERAGLIGAVLAIDSAPGNGTRVQMS